MVPRNDWIVCFAGGFPRKPAK